MGRQPTVPDGGPGGLAILLLGVLAAIILYAALTGRVHW